MVHPETLNLNNEVVKMRKEVKRIRVLVIRKLVRSVTRLKSKKGAEDALLKNQRRAQRLLEEIHAMKELKPDTVTRSALGDDINFEKICKKPDSTAAERAVARLAAHPLLKKKVDGLKAAVQAFKDARQNVAEVGSSESTSQENPSKDGLCSKDDGSKSQEGVISSEQKMQETKVLGKKQISNSTEKVTKKKDGPRAGKTAAPSPSKASGRGSAVALKSQKTPAEPEVRTLSQTSTREASESSRGDSSDDEAGVRQEEYFDDSTEERFYRQSSMSEEESDSGDDFFIGKVKRTRKKDRGCHGSVEEHRPPQKVLPKQHAQEAHRDHGNDESKSSMEARKFESVFFHSLSGAKSSKSIREQAPKSRTLDFTQDKPQIKSQFRKNTQKGPQNTKPPSQLPLHPSWEASRKRKEQQSKIAVFQGKKITFDD
ncbi:serum response factor-binding protein 1 isoform X2 [Ochotona curzoniae]|uniref:serum response factor-binding protein 1 isoform X2 n=1 Tax=Ochotona curzoniae TaxID=130825 RepID=UPI001B34CB18|nr:serum response factor-binding protein 1 isoform X2 [Ochotona curzoniae]